MIWITLFLRSWTLLIGLSSVFIGQGLLFILITYRGRLEGFSTSELGFLMSIYFIGYLLGSTHGIKFIASVGHVRVFGALSALSSVIFLLLFMLPQFFDGIGMGKSDGIVLPTYISWAVLRFINGYAIAVIMIVAESWLNEQSDNDTRGKNLSLYMMFSWGAPVLGQMLLWFFPPESNMLFLFGSIFVSIAAIPILISAKSVPEFDFPDTVSIKSLYKISPVGLIGCFLAGCIHGNFFSSNSLFSDSIFPGDQAFGATVSMIVITSGILIIPISGFVSDLFDRRKVLFFMALIGAGLTIGAVLFLGESKLSVYIWLGIIGTMVLPTYSLAVSHTNDRLTPKQMVSASATLVLIYSLGMAIAPIVTGQTIELFGPYAFLYITLALFFIIVLFCGYRMTVSEAPKFPAKDAVTVTPTLSTLSSVFQEEAKIRDENHSVTNN